MSEVQTHHRTCNICEAMCGIEIQHRGEDILSIKGDPKDPFSRGHICPKAVALQDFYKDPDRLRHPVRRTNDGWREIGWQEAFDEIATRFRKTQGEHGPDSVGVYLGNPNAHNFGNLLFLPIFFKALGSKNRFSSASADQLPHHVAADYMFGHGLLIPIPDIDRTDALVIIGGNPVVSNGSMMSAPGVAARLKGIQARGGKVVVVDPRRTETAKLADEHVFIRPEKDALLLLAMLHTIVKEAWVDLGHMKDIVNGLETIVKVVEDFSPEMVATATGIEAEKIKELAGLLAKSPSAVCYSRMGASTQSFGGLCQWLTNVMNVVTGNFDREGGAMFTLPAFDFLGMRPKRKHNPGPKHSSRVRNLPFYNGEFPISTLADEILSDGEGQIKSMITIAGNPVLSAPNGRRIEDAFKNLDFMVSVDVYINETTRLADIILPPVTGLQSSHYDVIFHLFAVRNSAKYSAPMFEKNDDQYYDWEILKALTSKLTGIPDDGSTPESILDRGLKNGPYAESGIGLEKLMAHPHGIDFGPNRPCLKERLRTDDGRLNLAPAVFVEDLKRLKAEALNGAGGSSDFPLTLISRRLLRSHNTWTQNSKRLVKGKNPCTVLIHPKDAERCGVANQDIVLIQSATGRLEIEAEVDDQVMEGVISIPQGWGHGGKGVKMTVAATQPGVSINDLTDEKRIDTLTGNAAFNGVPVSVKPLSDS